MYEIENHKLYFIFHKLYFIFQNNHVRKPSRNTQQR